MNKEFKRIEAKLDAILKALKVKPEDYEVKPPAAQAQRALSPAQQQAIANAPKPTPPPVAAQGPRVTATNAPSVASSVPKVADVAPKADAKKD